MNQHNSKLTLSVFRSLEVDDGLFDFSTPITEEVFLINGTSQIYKKKNC